MLLMHSICHSLHLFRADEDVGHVLVLAEQRDVEQDLQRLRVGGEHDELGLAAVEGLGGLVGALAQLLVVDGLLHQVQDLGGERLVRQRVRLRVHLAVRRSHRGASSDSGWPRA